jgi:hypothetical protein
VHIRQISKEQIDGDMHPGWLIRPYDQWVPSKEALFKKSIIWR